MSSVYIRLIRKIRVLFFFYKYDFLFCPLLKAKPVILNFCYTIVPPRNEIITPGNIPLLRLHPSNNLSIILTVKTRHCGFFIKPPVCGQLWSICGVAVEEL